ncbi:MAG: hypothetical protein IJ498_06560 [Akkermansia sp.]|nr:hypothetical protein [Akkermansia sp.]
MTINKLRELVEGTISSSTRVKNDIIYTFLRADDDFRYDVGIVYSLTSKGWLHIRGFCSDLKVSSDRISDAIIYCNKHNKDSHFPTAFYDMEDRDFNLSWTIVIENASDECIRDHIKLMVPMMWRFFVNVGKEF